jgi:hypothetical protein
VTDEQSKFDGWAVVEIFGHQRYAGYVTTQAFGQAVMFRVDVPPLEERERVTKSYEYVDGTSVPPGSTVKEAPVPGYTKLFGVGAIYGITPCTQDAAVKAVAAMQTRKLQLVSLAPERALADRFDDQRITDEADADDSEVDEDDDTDADDEREDDETELDVAKGEAL